MALIVSEITPQVLQRATSVNIKRNADVGMSASYKGEYALNKMQSLPDTISEDEHIA